MRSVTFFCNFTVLRTDELRSEVVDPRRMRGSSRECRDVLYTARTLEARATHVVVGVRILLHVFGHDSSLTLSTADGEQPKPEDEEAVA